ncbi:Deoxyribose-phosphate aldolase, partial [Galemys pyrenaicus]
HHALRGGRGACDRPLDSGSRERILAADESAGSSAQGRSPLALGTPREQELPATAAADCPRPTSPCLGGASLSHKTPYQKADDGHPFPRDTKSEGRVRVSRRTGCRGPAGTPGATTKGELPGCCAPCKKDTADCQVALGAESWGTHRSVLTTMEFPVFVCQENSIVSQGAPLEVLSLSCRRGARCCLRGSTTADCVAPCEAQTVPPDLACTCTLSHEESASAAQCTGSLLSWVSFLLEAGVRRSLGPELLLGPSPAALGGKRNLRLPRRDVSGEPWPPASPAVEGTHPAAGLGSSHRVPPRPYLDLPRECAKTASALQAGPSLTLEGGARHPGLQVPFPSAPAFLATLVGFKPAGGIRTAKDSLAWLSLVKEELGDEWLKPDLFRIGASTLLSDIERQ